MDKPRLCTKHFNRVANYFDKRVAFEFEIDGESCLVCSKTINVEMARWFIQQNEKEATALSSLQLRASRAQARSDGNRAA